MDEAQRRSLLQSIAISSGAVPPGGGIATVTQADRNNAFNLLDRFKRYNKTNDLDNARRVVSCCIDLLSRDALVLEGNPPADVTTPTKLYALGCISDFVRTRYYTNVIGDADRASLRTSVLTAARQLIFSGASTQQQQQQSRQSADEARAMRRILGSKISALLSDLVLRDFPQRWTNFGTEVLGSTAGVGLWNPTDGDGIGSKMCLECLSFVVEDCTDSDFNAKISTSRRNDVLTGLNEISSKILPLMVSLISDQYAILSSTKKTLFEMEAYLASNGRKLGQMTSAERTQYEAEKARQEQAGSLIGQCLVTAEKFCRSMPMEWTIGTDAAPQVSSGDFVAAFLFLLREETMSLQVLSVACLEAVALRKLDFGPWFRLVSSLPQSIVDANNVVAQEESARQATMTQLLIDELPYHRALSRMLSSLLSAHVSHITNDKEFLNCTGSKYQTLSAFLGVLSEMLNHPSGRIFSEQINMWVTLLRDPQISKTQLLSPHLPQVLNSGMKHLVKIRWDDVDEGTHPLGSIIDASWSDKEEYDTWLNDLRSKTSQLFKFIANSDPQLASTALSTKMQSLLSAHPNGEPRDHLDTRTGRLTSVSEAILQFDGIQQPMDNILQGIPPWCMKEDGPMTHESYSASKTSEIRGSVRASLSQLASAIVSWSPADALLRLSRTSMLRILKFYWMYDPTTLPAGVDSLLVYLSANDEWMNTTDSSVSSPGKLSDEVIGLRKKSGIALISVSKHIPHLLVPWIGQLSERARTLLSDDSILPTNRMHLYEFLSCVATAIEDPAARANFVADVLSDALNVLDTAMVNEAFSSTEALLGFLGITQAASNPGSVTDRANVKQITDNYCRAFSALNMLLSVGKRCNEAAKKRPNGGIPMLHTQTPNQQQFPDEGPVSINDIAYDDPFVPLWPRFLPVVLRAMDVTLRMWHPEYQALLLPNAVQRFAYAISDDEAYLAKTNPQDSSSGGVFGEGGTAGSIVSGWDRRDLNLVPRWSGWLNELRNVCFQLLGLLVDQRVLYSPEIAGLFPELVKVVADPSHLRAMEHRHFTQYMKQFVEHLMLSCPSTLYRTHLSPLLGPMFEHFQSRLYLTWDPILNSSTSAATIGGASITAALTPSTCDAAASLAARGDEQWFASYYARCGLFVGDLDNVTSEAAVEKARVELSRSFSDMMQSAFALKGQWGLVLANIAKEEQALKKHEPSKLTSGPATSLMNGNGERVNADGTVRSASQEALEARQILRINGLCHFLLLEDERVAGSLVLSIIQCLGYPDAYTCRRVTRICHRILETVASEERYTNLLGQQMFSAAIKSIVTEPKWMVGIEWDMIAVVRDMYCRLVLGQTLQPGGQGAAMQQPRDVNNKFEQSKNVGAPLQGGGVLCVPSELPQQLLASLPGIDVDAVKKLNSILNEKLAAKDQRDNLRDFLRIAAESLKEIEGGTVGDDSGIFGRAVAEESVLSQKARAALLPDIPEKLVTHSQLLKKAEKERRGSEEHVLFGSDLFK